MILNIIASFILRLLILFYSLKEGFISNNLDRNIVLLAHHFFVFLVEEYEWIRTPI